MEILNYNDMYRNYLSKKLSKYKDDENQYDKILKGLYYDLSNNKDMFKVISSIMYITSYVVNYTCFKKKPNDEAFIYNMNFLNSFLSVNELIKNFNYDTFKMFCDDVILFDELSFFARKKCILNTFNDKNEFIKLYPLFINDVMFYNVKYNPSYIMDEYYKRLNKTGNKKIAFEDSIYFGVEFLARLEQEDYDNYCDVFNDISNIYYEYNKYLLKKGIKIDDNELDLLNMYEKDPTELLGFSTGNIKLLKYIVKDYMEYSLLSDKEKQKIKYVNENKVLDKDDDLLKRTYINNPNSMIRKSLYEMLGF